LAIVNIADSAFASADVVGANATTPAVSPFVTWPLRVLGALLVMYALFVVPGDTQRYENLLSWLVASVRP
jgi:hypothetical protein